MHTPVEFYVTLPADLFRSGTKSKAKFDYIRTMPPRTDDQTWDIRIYDKNGVQFVDARSGGLSLFNYRNPRFGNFWWKLPKGTKVPSGLHISLDDGGRDGKHHFTVRPLMDMALTTFIEKLKALESQAIPSFLSASNEKAS
ncbi:hypothetical protein PVT67_13255 [Gallaecimonas kandeliae]|uniref:Tse2 family ADP-ribosyltransferase toxin n=1 Tax=Gallaecimonas kandeliae TaxID=3029055 RepID=UPI002647FEAD|nr:hypothetical protein [Gallaecimonas kandeliae]WKE64630.1 hypothetical protein PVT67_13255 [Gallaecimonas kandeliae]